MVNLPNSMIVASSSNAPAYITHFRDDELQILKNEGDVSTQCNNGSTDPTMNAVRYKRQ